MRQKPKNNPTRNTTRNTTRKRGTDLTLDPIGSTFDLWQKARNDKREKQAKMTAEIRQQFAKLAEDLANAEPKRLPRTWGFEVETPDADSVYDNTNGDEMNFLNFTEDASVKDENGQGECTCGCRACNYHECNCDNCEDYNEDPEHDCGSGYCRTVGNYQEITSIGGLDNTKPEALALLEANGLGECSVNETCGLHIHLGSSDLSPVQVANVITAYRLVANILEPIAGRRGVYYAKDNKDEDIDNARNGYGTEKYRAVNTAHHFSQGLYKPRTLEFRQHAGTNDTATIRAWAYLLVRLVEFAKDGRNFYWIARAKDLNELLEVIR